MKHLSSKSARYIFVAILTLGIATGIYDMIYFGHFHQLSYGTIVFHFHPYDKSSDTGEPVKNHHHTEKEFLNILLQNTSMVYLPIIFVGLAIRFLVRLKFDFTGTYKKIIYNNPLIDSASLRGPPKFSF